MRSINFPESPQGQGRRAVRSAGGSGAVLVQVRGMIPRVNTLYIQNYSGVKNALGDKK
jgi:hypothetical protein